MPRFEGLYIFTSTGGEWPISTFSHAKPELDKLAGVIGWRFHDVRREGAFRWDVVGSVPVAGGG